jgi:hypothetical protein
MVTIQPHATDSLDAAALWHSLVRHCPDASSLDECLSVQG